MRRLAPEQIPDGSRLAEDALDAEGRCVLPANTLVTPTLRAQLAEAGISSVAVRDIPGELMDSPEERARNRVERLFAPHADNPAMWKIKAAALQLAGEGLLRG